MRAAVRLNPALPPVVLTLLAHRLRWQLVAALARGDRRAQELAAALGQPANLVSYHLGRLAQAGLVRQHPSAADRRATYYSLDLPQVQALYAQAGQAVHPALSQTVNAQTFDAQTSQVSQTCEVLPTPRVLFLCTHNSARSQMAEALTRHLSHGQVAAYSAGTEPTELHPLTVAVMQARGLALAGQRAKSVAEFLGQPFDFIITTCDLAREACPAFPGDPEHIHWSCPDPAAVADAAARRQAFQTTATELTTRINFLLLLISVERGQQRRASASAHLATR